LVGKTIKEYDRLATVDIAYAEVGSDAWKSVTIFKEALEPSSEALKQAVSFIRDNCAVASSAGTTR